MAKCKKYYKFHLDLYNLLPTQAVVGDIEVFHKIRVLLNLISKKRSLDAYLKRHVVPTVIGPGNKPYIIDHHHFLKAIMQTKCTAYVYSECIMNLRHMKVSAFWYLMMKNNWVYLKDENGVGISPKKLPKNMWRLKNDPYRSLAWMAREYGGFRKVNIPFSEFQWANFFRKRIKIHHKDHHLHNALQKALKLARSKQAKHLPGYKGKR